MDLPTHEEQIHLDLGLDHEERPKHRDECRDGPRPCPWASCEHSLLVDIGRPRGSTGKDSDELEVHDRAAEAIRLGHTCLLDVTAEGPATLVTIAEIIGTSRERVRQIEAAAIRKLTERAKGDVKLREQLDALIRASDQHAACFDHISDEGDETMLPSDPVERRKEISRRANRRQRQRKLAEKRQRTTR
jgi:hypothetical protein